MAAFASDDFESHTGGTDLVGTALDVGETWADGSASSSPSPLTTTFGAPIGKGIRQEDPQTSFTYATVVPGSADYYVQAEVQPLSGGCGGVAGVCGRKDAGTGSVTAYVADYYDHATAGSRQWRLYGYSAGSLIGAALFGTYTENIGTTLKTLKLAMIGSSIKLYVDGVERVAATDSTITAVGRAGVLFGAASAPATNSVFLNAFSAELISADVAAFRRRPSGLYTR